ncbi:hypothetical protein BJ742DRAFT_402782 [Cladochytrium replicatum]|nr:hypothetical protein BJ742DRAFT_402782 [Cladochytrium replicatum]
MRPSALLLLAAALAGSLSDAASLNNPSLALDRRQGTEGGRLAHPPHNNEPINPHFLNRVLGRRQGTQGGKQPQPIQPPYGYDPANPGWSQNLIVDPSASTTTGAGAQPSAVAGDAGGNATNGDGSAPSVDEILNPNNNPVSDGAGATTGAAGATATTTDGAGAATTTTGAAAATGSTSLLDAGPTQAPDGSVPSDLAGIDIPSGAVPAVTGGADGNANGGATTATTTTTSTTAAAGGGGNDGGAVTTTTTTTEGGADVTTPPGNNDGGNYTPGRRFRCKPKSTTVRGGAEEVTTTPCTKTTTTTTPCTKTTTTTPCTKTNGGGAIEVGAPTDVNVDGGATSTNGAIEVGAPTDVNVDGSATSTSTPCTKTKKKKTKTKTMKSRPTNGASFQDVENASDSMVALLAELQSSVDIPGLIADLKETTGVNKFELSALLSNLVQTFNTKSTISVSDVVQAINDAAGGTDVSSAEILADFVDSLKNGAKESDVISLLEKLADSVKDFSQKELDVLAQMIEKAQFSDA